jgi:hypothetical protein
MNSVPHPHPGAAAPAATATATAMAAASSVVLRLGLREAWFVTRHPAVLIGTLLTVVLAVTMAETPVHSFNAEAILTTQVLGPATLIAANRCASRDRRAGSSPVVDVCPASIRARTAGSMLAVLGPAGVAVVLGGVVPALHVLLGIGTLRWPTLAEAAVQPVSVLGAGLVGVLAARWLPCAGSATLALAAVATWSAIGSLSPLVGEIWREFAPFTEMTRGETPNAIEGYFPGSVPWRVGYLLSLDTMATVGALLATPGPKRVLLLCGAAAVTTAAVTGWLQLP